MRIGFFWDIRSECFRINNIPPESSRTVGSNLLFFLIGVSKGQGPPPQGFHALHFLLGGGGRMQIQPLLVPSPCPAPGIPPRPPIFRQGVEFLWAPPASPFSGFGLRRFVASCGASSSASRTTGARTGRTLRESASVWVGSQC